MDLGGNGFAYRLQVGERRIVVFDTNALPKGLLDGNRLGSAGWPVNVWDMHGQYLA